jgi:hypothetical protein
MSDFSSLAEATHTFFGRHWSVEACPSQLPEWKSWSEFLYGSVPNYDMGGCYALFANSELLYVGLGASKGGGPYANHGISRRLMAHVLASDRHRGASWSKLRDPWGDVTALYTIGFPNGVAYLAAALESFLIRELDPPRNSRV